MDEKMSVPSLENLNKDVTSILERMTKLDEKLAVSAQMIDGQVGGVEMRDYQLQLLQRLRTIRDTMLKEGSSIENLTKERDEARLERDVLAKDVAKLQYRVKHLMKHVHVNGVNDEKNSSESCLN